jgi:serine/threonine-protein phosphatase 2A regulatory subunit A
MAVPSVFEFFKAEVTHEDVMVRTEAMLKLPVILATMESVEIREKLIPLLESKTSVEDPEVEQVLVAMAKHLGKVLPYMDGAQYAGLLLPMVETLFGKEEAYIRDYAAKSCSAILGMLGTSNLAQLNEYKDMFHRLVPVEDNGNTFYAKASCAQIIPALLKAYGNFDDDADGKNDAGDDKIVATRKEIRDVFYRLQGDENVMVRVMGVNVFLEMVAVCDGGPETTTELLAALRTFLGDSSSCISESAISLLPHFTVKLHELEMGSVIRSELLPIIKDLAESGSWRVRQAVTKDFGMYVTAFDKEMVVEELFPVIVSLLKDLESEVRQIVIPELYPFLACVPIDAFNAHFLALAESLTDDPVVPVRKLLAELLVEICSTHRDITAMQGMIHTLLKDEEPSVQLRVLNKVDVIARDLPDLAKQMTPTIKEMFTRPSWRVRQKVIQCVVPLATHLGKDHFVDAYLDEYIGLFRDSVDEVRRAASEILPRLVPVVGVDFTYVLCSRFFLPFLVCGVSVSLSYPLLLPACILWHDMTSNHNSHQSIKIDTILALLIINLQVRAHFPFHPHDEQCRVPPTPEHAERTEWSDASQPPGWRRLSIRGPLIRCVSQ